MTETPVYASKGARIAVPNKDASLPPRNDKLARFEAVILPHLDAAYNLARWLTRHEQNAEDVVQEAYLRAYQYFDRFEGDAGRAWLLRIVRNTCYTWLDKNRPHLAALSLSEEGRDVVSDGLDPEAERLVDVHRKVVEQALADLPPDLREVVVLREIEQLSYKEIAVVAEIPLGTVMSRLARGRQQLHPLLQKRINPASDPPGQESPEASAARLAMPGARPSLGASESMP
jgi:RNA polymerase sigma factor (sigma-70 family)